MPRTKYRQQEGEDTYQSGRNEGPYSPKRSGALTKNEAIDQEYKIDQVRQLEKETGRGSEKFTAEDIIELRRRYFRPKY